MFVIVLFILAILAALVLLIILGKLLTATLGLLIQILMVLALGLVIFRLWQKVKEQFNEPDQLSTSRRE
jgi:hypothetical protein